MSAELHIFSAVFIMAVITALLRFLPFYFFGHGRKTPAIITYLGKVLPFAIMGMLVIYCLRNISFTAGTHGLPELIACLITVLLHIWRKNTLLSIAGGTVSYMLLLHLFENLFIQ